MNIGLIAMSGIRACDQELMKLGLTMPGFVERGRTIASLPSLGLLTLAGLTPKKHRVHYVEASGFREAGETLPYDFDLVAISALSAQVKEAYRLALHYRSAGIPVVMGGLHVSCLPEEAAEFCDSAVVGEGELSWLQLLDDFERRSLKPRYGSLRAQFDMRCSPLPAFELLDPKRYNRLTVQTSRGCPFRCEFCASSILLTTGYKQKPKERVLAEIQKIRELWPRPFLEFADDNSFVDRPYWKELLRQLVPLGIRWFAETDISVAQDQEMLGLMYDSGCAEVLIGLESPLETGLDGLELKSNWKLRKFREYRSAVRKIQSSGIRVNGCFILGLDGHGPEVFDRVIDFANECELFDVQITIQTPFPGTPLYTRLSEQGRILQHGAWERCTLFDVNFQPDGMSVDQLRQGFRELARRLYSKEATVWRKSRFRQYLRERARKVAHACAD